MIEISRKEARRRVAAAAVSGLTEADRRALLDEWWSADLSDDERRALSAGLQHEIDLHPEPQDSVLNPRYDPILILAIMYTTYGVKNSWLEASLARVEGVQVKVYGVPEPTAPCRCCGYRALRERGNYEVCRVCFWEDDGAGDIHQVSPANHMTLNEGRLNFANFGACTREMLPHVLVDGPERYEREEVERIRP